MSICDACASQIPWWLLAQIVLCFKMLKFSKTIVLKEQFFLKQNEESFGTFENNQISKWNLQN